uniref:SAM domain-containing protein n=1 Tax=Balaenoptera musculus TaxID=9771 RepID=A0A8C0HX25_BALMU
RACEPQLLKPACAPRSLAKVPQLAPGSSMKARGPVVAGTMATSEWIQFFKEAGFPPGPAVNYAVMFVDNRIQKSTLLHVNKEVMNELGVTVAGHITAILKRAEAAHGQDVCKAATEPVPRSPSSSQARFAEVPLVISCYIP